MLSLLIKYNVGATFFFTGNNALKYPDLVRYVHENGFSIGNHSFSHSQFTLLSADDQDKEIMRTNEIMKNIISQQPTFFRPPYEEFNETTREILKKHEMKMALWNRDTRDWQARNPEVLIQFIRDTEPSGAVYLFHESAVTVEALPKIIEDLKTQLSHLY